MILFSLALKLRIDIDEVADWPYRKVAWWLAYFDARDRLEKRE